MSTLMLGSQTIDPQQCQAARALLGWSQAKLSALAGVASSALSRFENGGAIDIALRLAIKRVFEAADIEFTTSPDGASGVRLLPAGSPMQDPGDLA
jgi:transcriptional regulator with XRE-family HTH domain